tara:strand:- start:456 stop:1415 length:960 start_codon:yes stop_codon:yes gene_type:complete
MGRQEITMICNYIDNEDGEETRTTGRRKGFPLHPTTSAGGSSFRTGGDSLPSVSGMENNFGQLEFDFGVFPGEQEAHEVWLTSSGKNSLNDWAHQVMSRSELEGNGYEEVLQGLMIEGAAALKVWKKERGRNLRGYVVDRMYKRFSRLVSELHATDITQSASINQRQKFRRIEFIQSPTDDATTSYEMQLDAWIRDGEDPDLFHWLKQELATPDGDNENLSWWEQVQPYMRDSAFEDVLCGNVQDMMAQEIWVYVFSDKVLPLWSANLTADHIRVMAEVRLDPDASYREIGRTLGHTHKWVSKRVDESWDAIKGFVQEQ